MNLMELRCRFFRYHFSLLHLPIVIVRAFSLMLFFLMAFSRVVAQENTSGTERPRKLGIVLSGGGARGLAHIGVLKVFEEEQLDIKVITGTSMGSIIGGLYAIGYSSADLERVVAEIDWSPILADQISRNRESLERKMQEGRYLISLPYEKGQVKLPESLVAGQMVSELLSKLTIGYHEEMDFRLLPIPFACVAADIETGEPVLFEKGILPEAIRASMSIPTMFKPVEMNDRTWVDGGITRNLPAVEALEMGADVLIAVDVAPKLKRADELDDLLEIMEQTVTYSMSISSQLQKEYCDLVIEPELDLYTLNDYESVQEIIAAGEAAARKMLPKIRRIADSLNVRKAVPVPMKNRMEDLDRTYRISTLQVNNMKNVSLKAIRSDLNLALPATVSLKKLEDAVARVYGSGFFLYVRYRLIPEGTDGFRLVLDVKERQEKTVRMGFRFDSYNRASLLFNAISHNILNESGIATVDFRVGEDIMLDGQLYLHTSYQPRLGLRFTINGIQSNLDVFDDQARRIDNIQVNALYSEFLTGVMYRNWLVAGVGAHAEIFNYDSSIQPPALDETEAKKQRFLNFFGLLWLDRMDRSFFPEKGYSLYSRLSFSRREFGSPLNFTQHFADVRSFVPVRSDLSLFGRVYAGFSTDSDLPFHYLFYMGGANHPTVYGNRHVSFIGLPAVENSGQNIRMMQVGMQYEVMRDRYVQLVYNAGGLFPDWRNPVGGREIRGGGVVLGGMTPFGPIDLTFGASSANTLVFEINAGFRF